MDGPSPEHILEYAAARRSSNKIRRLILVGNIDGWSTIVLGMLGLLGSIIFFSIPGGLLGIAMTVIGWRQTQSTQSLRHLSTAAPRMMAINQLLLCVAVCLYCAWSLYSGLTTPSDLEKTLQQNPEVAQMIGGAGGLESTITITVYVGVIVGTILISGSTAWYYEKKTVMLNQYIQQTPEWIVQMQRTSDPL